MNSYCSIADVKGALGITATTDDTIIRKMCEAASRAIDTWTNRFFYAQSATRYFDGRVPLWVDDLLSITTIKTDEDGDGTFENTLTVTTDYLLYPLNSYPKTKVVLSVDSGYGSFGASKKGCEIAGLWGYGDGSATPYIEDTTITEDLTAGEADIDVTSATNLSAGHTILIGTEQYYIYSISTLTLIVEPGVNGTTQATHTNGDKIYIYQYPDDIRQACVDLTVAYYQHRSKRGIKSEKIGDYSYTLEKGYTTELLSDSILAYRKSNI